MAAQDGQYGPDGEWRQGPGCMSSSSASECLQGAVRDGVRRCPAARGSMPGAHSGLVHLRALVLAPPSAHLRWVVRRGQRAGGGIGGGSGCTPHEDGMCDGGTVSSRTHPVRTPARVVCCVRCYMCVHVSARCQLGGGISIRAPWCCPDPRPPVVSARVYLCVSVSLPRFVRRSVGCRGLWSRIHRRKPIHT